MQKYEFYPYLTPYININSKWIRALNIKHKTRKLLEKHVQEKLCNLELGKNFLNITLKS